MLPVKPALGKAPASFRVLKVEEEAWSDDRLDFRVRALGQVAAGIVQVGEDSVRLEVTLPWLLHKFGEVTSRRSEEHTSELQSHVNLVCRLLLEKKKKYNNLSR